jgi:hypothetical protein
MASHKPATAATYSETWNGATSNWSTAPDWSAPSVVPNNSADEYNAIINAGTITLDISPTIDQFSLTTGTLLGTATLTANAAVSLSGAHLGSSTAHTGPTINAAGGMSINTNAAGYLYGGTINNSGTAIVTGTGQQFYATGGNAVGTFTTFNNLSTATFNIEGGLDYYTTNNASATEPDVFNNAGILEQTSGGYASTVSAELINSGSVSVQSGNLDFNGGGTETGSFAASTGETLTFGGGTFNFNSGSAVEGLGTIAFTGGTSNFNTGSTLNPTGTVQITSSNLTLNSNQSIAALTMGSGGNVLGTSTLTTGGLMTWSGGKIGSSTTHIGPTIDVNGASSINLNVYNYFYGGVINNSGTATITGTGHQIYATGANAVGATTMFNNLASGTFNIQGGLDYSTTNNASATAPDVFDNAGLLEQTNGGYTASIEAEFNNSGTVSVQSGTLNLDGGGTETGSLSVATGNTLQFAGQTFNFNAGAALSGAGAITFTGGTCNFNSGSTFNPTGTVQIGGTAAATVNVNSTQSISALILGSSGILAGTGTLNTTGLISWTGGYLGTNTTHTGPTVNAQSQIALNSSTYNYFYGGVINNSGALTVTGNGHQWYATGGDTTGTSTTFNNLAAGTFNIQGGLNYYTANTIASLAPDILNNAGLLEQTSGGYTNTISAEFNNSGSISVQNGTLNLAGGGTETGTFAVSVGDFQGFGGPTFNFNNGTALSGAGTFEFSAGVNIFNSAAIFDPAANVSIAGGKVVLNATQTIGTLTISNGRLDLTNTHLLIQYGPGPDPASTLIAYLKTGIAGTWTGLGIDSSVAAVNTNYGVAFGDGRDGAAGLSSGTIRLGYSLYGDINQDGVVNGTDFAILAAHFGQTVTGGWEQGDLNYDGVVNGTDFSLLAENFGQSANGATLALPASQWASLFAFAENHGLMADVPEPVGSIGLGLGYVLCMRSRRRRRPRNASLSGL